jgi:hypothetical protein
LRQLADVLGEPPDLVDQAAGLVGFDEVRNPGLLQGGAQLVEVLRAGQEREFALFPGVVDRRRVARWSDEGRHQDIGIEHYAHQALSAFLFALR